jgi:hypothetical protein
MEVTGLSLRPLSSSNPHRTLLLHALEQVENISSHLLRIGSCILSKQSVNDSLDILLTIKVQKYLACRAAELQSALRNKQNILSRMKAATGRESRDRVHIHISNLFAFSRNEE